MTSKENAEIKLIDSGDSYAIYDIQTFRSSPSGSSGNQFVKQRYVEENDVQYEELSSQKLGLFSGPRVRSKTVSGKIMESSSIIIVYEKDDLLENREFIR